MQYDYVLVVIKPPFADTFYSAQIFDCRSWLPDWAYVLHRIKHRRESDPN